MFALIIFLPSYMNTSLSLRVFIFTIYIDLIWIFNAKILCNILMNWDSRFEIEPD